MSSKSKKNSAKIIIDNKNNKNNKNNINNKKNVEFNNKIKEYSTEINDDGETDTDYNEELEEEYDIDTQDEVEREEDNIDDQIDESDVEEIEDPEDEVVDVDETVDQEDLADDEGCLYNFTKKKKIKENFDSDDEYEDELSFDDDEDDVPDLDKNSKFVLGDDRITLAVLSKHERVRILAERSKQLMLGAKPMLKNTENIHPKDIARLELEKGVIPYKIHRERPDGKIEEWHVNELEIVN